MAMVSKEQLRNIASSCGHYHYVGDANTGMKSEARVAGDTVRSCESCTHFTQDHKCDINLIDRILTNMAEVQYE